MAHISRCEHFRCACSIQTLGALHDTQRSLAAQNKQIDAALSNKSQRARDVRSSAHLVVCNNRYLDMFGSIAEIIKPGLSPADVLFHRVATAAFPPMRSSLHGRAPRRCRQKKKTFSKTTKFAGYRIIFNVNQPVSARLGCHPRGHYPNDSCAEERIKRLAHYDALTDPANARLSTNGWGRRLSHLRRSEIYRGVSLDLDHYKSVNDTLGHPIGDRLLQAAGRTHTQLRPCRRRRGAFGRRRVCRRAGAIEHPADITALATRLIEAVGAPYDINGQSSGRGGECPASRFAPSDSDLPDVLMKDADLALYRRQSRRRECYTPLLSKSKWTPACRRAAPSNSIFARQS